MKTEQALIEAMVLALIAGTMAYIWLDWATR